MKAITLTQPWASLVALGLKQIETRSWRTHHRGLLAIHAGKGLPVMWRPFIRPEFQVPLGALVGLNAYGAPDLRKLPRGEVLAVCEVWDCVPTEEAWPLIAGQREEAYGDFSPGRWAWLLRDVRPVEPPVPWRGAQGLWSLDDSVLMELADAPRSMLA